MNRFLTWFASLGWRDSLCVTGIAFILAICLYGFIEKHVKRWKAGKRRHSLNRLNRPSFFRDLTSNYYRVRK